MLKVRLPTALADGQRSIVHANFWYMAPSYYRVRHSNYNRWETWPSPPHSQSKYGCLGMDNPTVWLPKIIVTLP